tara:strand:- start:248 stop:535 length:288 start_codon:yes stop_codon:yes gene_type:complete
MANKLNFYQTGGVERHPDGSFSVFGYIQNETTGEDIARHKVKYFDYSLKDARRKHQQELKAITEVFKDLKIFSADAFDNTYSTLLPFGGVTLTRG